MMQVFDPVNYFDRLSEIPKLAVFASDDEFLMMDWTNIWYNQMTGEKHLLILPNASHGMAENWKDVLTSVCAFIKSLA